MRANAILFWILAAFFACSAIVYSVWTAIDEQRPGMEWAGTVALSLHHRPVGVHRVLPRAVHKAQGAELPRPLDANIDDGDAELGFFSPWSWWPIVLAAAPALGIPRSRDRILDRVHRDPDRGDRPGRLGRTSTTAATSLAERSRSKPRRDGAGAFSHCRLVASRRSCRAGRPTHAPRQPAVSGRSGRRPWR
jgi:hypothetical protein